MYGDAHTARASEKRFLRSSVQYCAFSSVSAVFPDKNACYNLKIRHFV